MRKILLVLTMMSMLIFTACGNDSDSIVTTASTTTEAVTTEPSQTENPVTVTHSDVSEPDITEPAVTTEAVSDQITTTTTVVSEDTQNPVTVTHSEVTTVTTTVPVTTEKTTTTVATTKPATTTTVPTTAEQTTTTAVTFETSAAVEQLKLDILGYGNYNYEEYYDKFGNYILKMYHIWGGVEPSFYNDRAEWLYSENGVIKYKNNGTPYLRSEIVVSYYDENQEAELLRLINEARAANGLTTLVQDESWAIFADRYAKFMADVRGLKHSGIAWEIVGRGQDTAQEMFDDFWNSEGHRKNMLSQAGVNVSYCAVSRYYKADTGWFTVVVLEDTTYAEHFDYARAILTEVYFSNNGDTDDFVNETYLLTQEEMKNLYYKPEYNVYYPHLAQ